MAHIAFGPLNIAYDDRVLRPRPWTEMQADWGSELLDSLPEGPVLEIGAGAGQIGFLTVEGHERPLVSVDASAAACEWARTNARTHGIDADVRCGSMRDVLHADERFVLITADPPWVPRHLVSTFPDDPVSSIDGGPDGLDVARECLELIARHLHPEGRALLQLGGPAQVEQLRPAIADSGLAVTELRDAEGGVVLGLRRQ